MSALLQTLADIDEEYLIGLSNKGIVKRAVKDMQDLDIKWDRNNLAEISETDILIGQEKCHISLPLAESTCSCPSRSICRHIITGILFLKKQNESTAGPGNENKKKELNEEGKVPASLETSLRSVELSKLKKAMKLQAYNELLYADNELRNKLVAIKGDRVLEGVIASSLFGEPYNVRLLDPLDYSTCSCHKKEMCAHKAAVIFVWQLEHGVLNEKELQAVPVSDKKYDYERIILACDMVQKHLRDILTNGLVRINSNMPDSLNGAAVICHNAALAELERKVRELSIRLKACQDREASFSIEIFYKLMMECYLLSEKIKICSDPKTLGILAGTFRETYRDVGNIQLLPVGQRSIHSDKGFAGDIYYFINLDSLNPGDKDSYYMFSDVRPVYYDTVKKPRGSGTNAPWGLGTSMGVLMKSKLLLKNAKVSGGKLSSTSKCQGEICGPGSLNQAAVNPYIWTDYEKMLQTVGSRSREEETDGLVLAWFKRCINAEFDEITQEYRIEIEDIKNRTLTAKVKYKKELKSLFNMLDKLGKKMVEGKTADNKGLIFGGLYIEDGQAFIYPIEIYYPFHPYEEETWLGKETRQEIQVKKVDINHDNAIYAGQIQNYLEELEHNMQKLVQSGTVNSTNASYLRELSDISQKMGLLKLGESLEEAAKSLEEMAHQIHKDSSRLLGHMAYIEEYSKKALDHLKLVLALEYMCSNNKESV